MNKTLAIALFLTAVLFAFSGIRQMRARSVVSIDELAAFDASTHWMLNLGGAALCLVGGMFLRNMGHQHHKAAHM